MRLHAPETQTLYAQLLETATAEEVALFGGFANGFAVERSVRDRTYLYWQLRDLSGRLRQCYLGPATDEHARALRDVLVAQKERGAAAISDLRRLTAAYLASGGSRHQQGHFRVIEALARAGVFRAGAVLVGSHAFVSIGAALGVSWSSDVASTADIDLCRDQFVSIASEEIRPIDIPGVLRQLEPSFFLVPGLDLKEPSTSVSSRKAKVRVDFLTTAKTPRDTKPHPVRAFGLAATPLRYMDYLVRHDVRRGLFVGPYAIAANVPDPGRFALHKLAVATRRSGGADSIKADKDRRQAAALIEALAEIQPGTLDLAGDAAKKHHDRGLARDMMVSARRLLGKARDVALSALEP